VAADVIEEARGTVDHGAGLAPVSPAVGFSWSPLGVDERIGCLVIKLPVMRGVAIGIPCELHAHPPIVGAHCVG